MLQRVMMVGTTLLMMGSAVAGADERNQPVPGPVPARIQSSLPLDSEEARRKSVRALQQTTVDLLALVHDFKQAHWNLTGPLYLVLHEYYDEQAGLYTKWADLFAERNLHMGFSVDGRPSAIVATSTLPDMPAGWETDQQSLQLLIDRLTVLQKQVYRSLEELEKTDAPSSNKYQDLAHDLDKTLWQLRVHLQKPGSPGDALPWSAPAARP